MTKTSDDCEDFNFSLSQKLSSDFVSQAKLLNRHQTTNSRLSFLYSLQSSLERNHHKSSQQSLVKNPSLRKLVVTSSSAEPGVKLQGRVKLQSKVREQQPISSGFQVSSSKDQQMMTQHQRTISGQFVLVSNSHTPNQNYQKQPDRLPLYSPFSLLQTQKLPVYQPDQLLDQDSLDNNSNHKRSQYSDSLNKKTYPYI